MRIIGCCMLVLVLALMCVGVASANPGGGVKSSPLFKASLAQSIAKLEGKVQRETIAGNEDEDMPTGKRICPLSPLTQQTTCEPSWCGGETCDVSCGGTCWTTCTPATCYPGACVHYEFVGSVYYQSYYGWDAEHGLAYPYYVTDRPVYCDFEDEDAYYIGDFAVTCGYDVIHGRPIASCSAVIFARPLFQRYDIPGWSDRGYGDATVSSPSYLSVNYVAAIHVPTP